MSDSNAPRHIRHCMIVYAAYPHYETRVQREAEALIAHGIDVDVICPSYENDLPTDEHCGVRIYRVRQKWGRKKGLLTQFGQYIKFFVQASTKLVGLNSRRRYDTIQVHNLPDFLVFTTLIPKLMGTRVILDLHDLMPEFYQGKFGQGSKKALTALIRLQERLSCLYADHVITVTEHWRQTLIQRGVPPEKCSVVMNLADTRIFHELTAEEKGPAQDGRFCLFYHGDFPYRYGLDLVIRAVHQLRGRIPGLRFKLVGGGDYLWALRDLTKELDVGTQVEILDGVPVEKLPALIATADAGVVPYRDDVFTASLLPTKLLEYAVSGLPTIAAKTTAISAYFDDSMVEFFTPGDLEDLKRSIVELYTNKNRREQLGQGIREFHRRYNWPDVSGQYAALVERLALHGRKPA